MLSTMQFFAAPFLLVTLCLTMFGTAAGNYARTSSEYDNYTNIFAKDGNYTCPLPTRIGYSMYAYMPDNHTMPTITEITYTIGNKTHTVPTIDGNPQTYADYFETSRAGLPTGLVNCSLDLRPMNYTTTDAIVLGMFELSTTMHMMDGRQVGTWALGPVDWDYISPWAFTDQIYYCNYNSMSRPFSVAEYGMAQQVIDRHCGGMGGWVLFPEWKVLIGRAPTLDNGHPRSVCGLDYQVLRASLE